MRYPEGVAWGPSALLPPSFPEFVACEKSGPSTTGRLKSCQSRSPKEPGAEAHEVPVRA